MGAGGRGALGRTGFTVVTTALTGLYLAGRGRPFILKMSWPCRVVKCYL